MYEINNKIYEKEFIFIELPLVVVYSCFMGGKILLNGFIKHLMNLLKNQFWWFRTVQIGVMLRKTHCKPFKIALIWEWIWLKLI